MIIEITRWFHFMMSIFSLYPLSMMIIDLYRQRSLFSNARLMGLRIILATMILIFWIVSVMSALLSVLLITNFNFEANYGSLTSQILFNIRNLFVSLGINLTSWYFFFFEKKNGTY